MLKVAVVGSMETTGFYAAPAAQSSELCKIRFVCSEIMIEFMGRAMSVGGGSNFPTMVILKNLYSADYVR